MNANQFIDALEHEKIDFFSGVPDSLLSPFCDAIVNRFGTFSKNHVIAHNEGGAVALACGHYMATNEIACVYMQNSGIGNAVNPIASLAHPKVYGLPILFVIGWRGEPGTHDEPQHVFQGEATLQLLTDLGIEYLVVRDNTSISSIEEALSDFMKVAAEGKSAAFVIGKGAFTGDSHLYTNGYSLNRERAIELIAKAAANDPIVSTTGKISRELFEIRERNSESHEKDFLTVGSMGHSAMIALGVALAKPGLRVWCIDGDGSVLMHMGSLGIVGRMAPNYFIHVVLNNGAHETVGGMPTAVEKLDITSIACACGYSYVYSVEDEGSLIQALEDAKRQNGPILIEARVTLGSRSDLGRSTTTTHDNRDAFKRYLHD